MGWSSIVCCGLMSLLPQCRWLAAYTAAASFRYSHYFISFISQSSTIASGIGYHTTQNPSVSW